jgi:hypothetical protein
MRPQKPCGQCQIFGFSRITATRCSSLRGTHDFGSGKSRHCSTFPNAPRNASSQIW